MNVTETLVCFARDGERLFKIYDQGEDWQAVTLYGDGTTAERWYSKWRADMPGSLARAANATAPGLTWTSA